MKRIVSIYLLALKMKSIDVYWSCETERYQLNALRLRAESMGLKVSRKYPRLVYNPQMISAKEIEEYIESGFLSSVIYRAKHFRNSSFLEC